MFDLLNQSDLRQWATYVLSLATTAFLSFFAAFGSIGASMLARGTRASVALATALCGASLVMAGAVLASAKASPLWPSLHILLPRSVDAVIEGADLAVPEQPEDQDTPEQLPIQSDTASHSRHAGEGPDALTG